MGWLDDLPGIRNVVDRLGLALPKRNTLQVEGIGVSIVDASGYTRMLIDPWGSTTITPAVLTANQDDYGPDGWDTARIVRLEGTAARNLSGFVARDYPITIFNVSASYGLTILHESNLSVAANRVLTPGGASLLIETGGILELYRDTASNRWRAVRP